MPFVHNLYVPSFFPLLVRNFTSFDADADDDNDDVDDDDDDDSVVLRLC